jgi:hypothetical protein
MRILKQFTLLFILFAVCACTPSRKDSSSDKPSLIYTISEDNCLSPLHNLSYPATGYDELNPGVNYIVPPPHPWQIEADLPKIKGVDYSNSFYTNKQTLTIKKIILADGYYKIWVHIWVMGSDISDYLAMYRTDTKEWIIIDAPVDTLYVDSKGDLWGAISKNIYLEKTKGAFFGKYNEAEKEFELLKDFYDVIIGNREIGVETNSNLTNKILLDKNGLFWIIIQNRSIYSYDPLSEKMEHRIDISFQVEDVKIASDNSIYLLEIDNWSQYTGYPRIIHQYYPETNTMKSFTTENYLETSPTFHSIFIDSLNNLWFGSIGYRDTNDNWYQLYRSPFFVSASRDAYESHKYRSGEIVFESSDGQLWILKVEIGAGLQLISQILLKIPIIISG